MCVCVCPSHNINLVWRLKLSAHKHNRIKCSKNESKRRRRLLATRPQETAMHSTQCAQCTTTKDNLGASLLCYPFAWNILCVYWQLQKLATIIIIATKWRWRETVCTNIDWQVKIGNACLCWAHLAQMALYCSVQEKASKHHKWNTTNAKSKSEGIRWSRSKTKLKLTNWQVLNSAYDKNG